MEQKASKEELKSEIRRILSGIDQTEADGPSGWWETSAGAEFGAQKLAELESLIDSLKL